MSAPRELRDEVVVAATPAEVWAAIQDPARHAGWHPFVVAIHGQHALGAVRACDVELGPGRVARTEERCTAYEEERRILWSIEKDTSGFSRMVQGWTAGFELEPLGAGASQTRVRARSSFRPAGLAAALLMPVVGRKVHGLQRAILGALKADVEGARRRPGA